MLDMLIDVPELSELSVEQKVGQLIVTRSTAANVEENLAAGIVGGVCLKPSEPERIAELHERSMFPLLTAMDLETGCFSGSSHWPMAMTLGAADDEELAYQWGALQAIEARNSGINAVFGPVLDVAIDPECECLGVRALGDQPDKVAVLGAAVLRGYQENGLQTFAKHYPGFGRHYSDTHIELTQIEVSPDVMLREDSLPYLHAIENANLRGIMSGHVAVPAFDSELPSPVSQKIVEGFLNRINFQGVVITDSLAMKGIKSLYPLGELYVESFLAGHDLILTDYDLDDVQGHGFLLEAVESGRISMERLDRSVQKILDMKRWIATFAPPVFDAEQHQASFNEMSQRAITAVVDNGGFEPIADGEDLLFVIFWTDTETLTEEFASHPCSKEELVATIKKDYPQAEVIVLPEYPGIRQMESTMLRSMDFARVVPIVHTAVHCYRGTDHVSRPAMSLIRGMAKRVKTLVSLGNPYAIRALPKFKQTVFGYAGGDCFNALFNTIIGREEPVGKLPVNVWK